MTTWKFTKYLSDVDLENVTKDHVQRGVNSYFLSCFLICFTISPEKMLCFLIVMLCFSSFSVFQVPKSTHLIQTWGVQTVQMRRMWLFTRLKAWPLVTFCKPPSERKWTSSLSFMRPEIQIQFQPQSSCGERPWK